MTIREHALALLRQEGTMTATQLAEFGGLYLPSLSSVLRKFGPRGGNGYKLRKP